MDLKRIFRGWVLAILFVAIILVILYKLVNTGPEYKPVATSQAIAAINSGNVKSVTLTDVDQTIQLTTKSGANWESSWVGSQGTQLANTLQNEVKSGQLPNGVYTVKVPKSSSFWTLIFSYLPFLIIFLLFMVFLNQMQGGGSRVMNFGKSKAKLITKDTPKTTFADVAGADEAIEELQEIKEFLQAPASSRPSAPRSPRACCSTGRPEQARHCSPGPWPARPACRSTPSQARTSSRCSSVSVPPGCATCSSRPRPTRRPSCSWMRSTRSDGTAGPASAAGTTSGSKR